MKAINQINSEDILTIDIETVRLYKELKEAPLELQEAWEKKNTNNGEVPDFIQLSTLWKNKAPLYVEFSKVCAISISYLSEGSSLKVKTYYGESELDILESFRSDLILFLTHNRSYRLLGHASKFFDYPYLCKRYLINGLDIPSTLDESNCKPWEFKNLDTNELWRSFGTGAGSSLQALCCALNVPTSKSDLVGDEVGEAYYNKEFLRIGAYCSRDVISTFNVFRRYKKESIFEFDAVEYIFQDGKGKKHNVNVLDHIVASGELTGKVVTAIVEYADEHKLNKPDVLTLVKTALSKSKEYQAVNEEDFIELKDALGLSIDYSKIQCVVDKKNLGKKEVDILIKLYDKSPKKEKKEVVSLTNQFLVEKNKIGQKRAKEALDYLTSKLK